MVQRRSAVSTPPSLKVHHLINFCQVLRSSEFLGVKSGGARIRSSLFYWQPRARLTATPAQLQVEVLLVLRLPSHYIMMLIKDQERRYSGNGSSSHHDK
eukprot:2876053-Rhodomonas_salina.1